MDADRGLVDAAAAGDREAFDELVRRHQGQVLNLVQAMTGGGADADDLAQEAFVRAWRGLRHFRGDSTFRTWLYGVAVNVVRTHHRRRTRFSRLFPARGGGAEGEPDPIEGAAVEAGFDDALVMRNAIDKALGVLGVPIGTVESRIFRGRQKLRPLLEPLMRRGS